MAENPMKKCPSCQMDVPMKATKCPHCQSKIKPQTSKEMKWVIGILGVVTFVVFIWASSTSDHTPEVVQADPKQWASIYAEMSIKRLLKAPASADFCRETVTELGDNRYDVSSCVDSENSYGAKLRSNWQVIYKFSGGNPEEIGSWTPEKIIFDGKVVYPSE